MVIFKKNKTREKAKLIFKNGIRHFEKGDFRKALMCFETVLELRESHAGALSYLKATKKELLKEKSQLKNEFLRCPKCDGVTKSDSSYCPWCGFRF
ncbi:MAG: hypothetical protein ACE5HW_06315 [Candidatus Methanofastidiosia archaeon]